MQVKKLLLIICLCPLLSIAQIPEHRPNTYIDDSYGYLSPGQVQALNRQLWDIQTAYGVQVAVILVPTIPPDMAIEDYAREIGRKWHVGYANNGLVYVAAIDQHKQRLEVATRLEGTITDLRARELLDVVKAHFKSGHYYEGLSNMISALAVMLKPVQAEQKALLRPKDESVEGGLIVMGVVVLTLLGIFIWYWRIRRKIYQAENYSYTDPYPHSHSGYVDNSTNIYVAPQSDHYQSDSSSSSVNYSSSSSDSSSSSYDDYGSSSSDSSSSDSGFDGGGSSGDF